MRFLTSVFVAAILAATQATAEPEAVEFSDLADPLAVAFEDPYAAMGVDMLNELKATWFSRTRSSPALILMRRHGRVWRPAALLRRKSSRRMVTM